MSNRKSFIRPALLEDSSVIASRAEESVAALLMHSEELRDIKVDLFDSITLQPDREDVIPSTVFHLVSESLTNKSPLHISPPIALGQILILSGHPRAVIGSIDNDRVVH
jgi:hypothetical protein